MGVNDKKRGRPREEKLSAGMILAAAKAQLLQDGNKLSIRGLARQLNVDPMALYHYFENKNALLEAVAVDIMEAIYTPDPAGPWATELETLSVSYLTLLADHPVLLETLLGMTRAGMVFRARFETATAGLELDPDAQQAALNLLVDFLHGFALGIHASGAENRVEVSEMQGPFALYLGALRNATERS